MSPPEVTTLLQAWSGGDRDARDRLLAVVYVDLRRRAAAQLRRERHNHTLQPTALVHEAYLRLIGQQGVAWQNRAHFFAIASRMMRRILVDHARRGRMAKRSGRWAQVALSESLAGSGPPDIDVLAVHEALNRLAEFDARKSRIAELRYFGGLSLREIAHVLDISVATTERDWQTARAWLFNALNGDRS